MLAIVGPNVLTAYPKAKIVITLKVIHFCLMSSTSILRPISSLPRTRNDSSNEPLLSS